MRRCRFKMRQWDGEEVGERGLYARWGDPGEEAEITVCGAAAVAAAVAAAEVEIKLPAM